MEIWHEDSSVWKWIWRSFVAPGTESIITQHKKRHMYYSNRMIYVFRTHSHGNVYTGPHHSYKLICGNNRWWPEKRFYRRWRRRRRWQQCFCLSRALYGTDRVNLRPIATAAGPWTKLFKTIAKLGSFSDNKTETSIKSSRFKLHNRRDD